VFRSGLNASKAAFRFKFFPRGSWFGGIQCPGLIKLNRMRPRSDMFWVGKGAQIAGLSRNISFMRLFMRKILPLLIICIFPVASLFAQEFKRGEIYGGYQLLSDNEIFHGFIISAEESANRYFGVAGEFSYGQKKIPVADVVVTTKYFTFMAGPRFSLRGGKYRLFAELLLGGFRSISELGEVSDSALAFSMAPGAGLDININKFLSFRPVQFHVGENYMNTTSPADPEQIIKGWGTTYRYSCGFAFKF
jgi:hypothetical protein